MAERTKQCSDNINELGNVLFMSAVFLLCRGPFMCGLCWSARDATFSFLMMT